MWSFVVASPAYNVGQRRCSYNKTTMPACRFPPPWTVEEQDACIVVRDHNGQKLAYIYFDDEPGRRSAAKLLSRDEARRIAPNVAKLPLAFETAPGMTYPFKRQLEYRPKP